MSAVVLYQGEEKQNVVTLVTVVTVVNAFDSASFFVLQRYPHASCECRDDSLDFISGLL